MRGGGAGAGSVVVSGIGSCVTDSVGGSCGVEGVVLVSMVLLVGVVRGEVRVTQRSV